MNYNFKVFNNFSSGRLDCNKVKTTGTNEIFNNVIVNTVKDAILISVTGSPSAIINISNNVLQCSASSGFFEIDNSSLDTIVYAYHNLSPTDVFSFRNLTINVNNNIATLSISDFTVTGQNINNGLASDEFRDLDLSRNDVGNYGGSNSWANYWPTAVGNKPQVNYLNTPRRIVTGTTTMTAKASGYSK